MKLRTKLTVFSILLLAIAIALCCAIIISFAYQGEVESITSAGIFDFESLYREFVWSSTDSIPDSPIVRRSYIINKFRSLADAGEFVLQKGDEFWVNNTGFDVKSILPAGKAAKLSESGSTQYKLARIDGADYFIAASPASIAQEDYYVSLMRNDRMRAAAAELRALAKTLEASGGAVRLDLSLAGEMEYYNGLVFQGYLQGLPRPLLKGGRYDLLMQKFTPGAGAIGFAVYLDELDRLSAPTPPVQRNSTDRVMLNVALPKGRLGDRMYDLLARIGYGCTEDYNATRKLVVENPAAGIRYFLVKPSDVAIYVEHGAADVGIVGKDILTEASADVYELLDTGLGRCRMCVAAPADYKDDPSRPVRVATKFVNIAKSYYASIGRDIDIIKLNGSIELAPILGLSDVIVDIVETGTTLRENGLWVVTEFMPISARFIANKASYQFKHNEMDAMLEALRKTLQEETK